MRLPSFYFSIKKSNKLVWCHQAFLLYRLNQFVLKISVSCRLKWNNIYSFHTILEWILNIISRLINAENRHPAPVMSWWQLLPCIQAGTALTFFMWSFLFRSQPVCLLLQAWVQHPTSLLNASWCNLKLEEGSRKWPSGQHNYLLPS